jgi:hypothetical protein
MEDCARQTFVFAIAIRRNAQDMQRLAAGGVNVEGIAARAVRLS